MFFFLRFKHAFSRLSSRNIIKISSVMLLENILNFVLRLLVGLKLLFNSRETLENLVIPIVFAVMWATIYC